MRRLATTFAIFSAALVAVPLAFSAPQKLLGSLDATVEVRGTTVILTLAVSNADGTPALPDQDTYLNLAIYDAAIPGAGADTLSLEFSRADGRFAYYTHTHTFYAPGGIPRHGLCHALHHAPKGTLFPHNPARGLPRLPGK